MEAMRTRGLVAAAFAPMRPNGDVDVEAVPTLVEHLVREGVAGVFCNGTTGEGVSLTPEERRTLARAFVGAGAGRLRVFVQVGGNSLRVARELAAHAANAGADSIAATPPSYFKPASVSDLVESLGEIATAAPKVPLFYYHIPAYTGVRLDMLDLLRKAGDALPSFAGINYCFAAPVYDKVIAAHGSGDREAAREWQARARRMIDVQMRHGGLPALKATMTLIGVDCGPVRLPLRTLSPSAVDALRRDLEGIGFFDWGRG
jgi:N-acetylneuraminate lyase